MSSFAFFRWHSLESPHCQCEGKRYGFCRLLWDSMQSWSVYEAWHVGRR